MAHPLPKTIILLAVATLAAGPVAAHADSAANARAEAKKHYDRAMELNEDGQVAEAVIELKRCYELSPHHTVMYNLGQAYITLAKPVEAVAALQRYLDEGGKAIKPARRAEVEQEIARQKTRIATLEIRGLPDGAVVTIDGDEAGKAPLAAPVRVGVGTHVVAATAAGYEPGEAKIEIVGEDRRVVELKLVPRPGEPLPAMAAAPVSAQTASTPAAVAAPVEAPVAPIPAAAPATSSNSATWAQPAPGTNLAPVQGEVAASTETWRTSMRIVGIAATGVGAVGLIAGGILWQAAKDKNNDAVAQLGSNVSQARSTRTDAENLATGANVCLIAGGVLAGAGVIATLLGFVDDSPPSPNVVLAPALAPNFAGLTMNGIW
jgi:hypothetical protein